MKTLQYVVTFRRNMNDPQEEQIFFTKQAADAFALGIYLSGGVSITTETLSEEDDHDY